MARIVLQNVTKVFGGGETLAVDDVSIEIGDGEFMVLVGPSGCGKSTLLRIVAGLEDLTNGEVVIGDRVVTDLAPKDRDIAMVFQNYALYPHMTVRKNLGIGLKLRHTPKAETEQEGDARWPRFSAWSGCWSESRHSFRAVSDSAWRSAGRWCASRRRFSWMSRSPTSMPSCACRCAASWRACVIACTPPPSTSPTIRWRR